MSDAPERIWLQLGAGEYGTHTWCAQPQDWADENGEGEPEYVRADILKAELEAAVAAEREACAYEIHDQLRRSDRAWYPGATHPQDRKKG